MPGSSRQKWFPPGTKFPPQAKPLMVNGKNSIGGTAIA
jgi:hypothetical protein